MQLTLAIIINFNHNLQIFLKGNSFFFPTFPEISMSILAYYQVVDWSGMHYGL